MDLLTIQQRVLKRLDEDSSTPVYYSGQETIAAINEGQRLFALLTLCLEVDDTFSLAANTTYYHMLSVFPHCLLPLRLRVHGGAKLGYSSLGDLKALDQAWESKTGTPSQYAALGFDLLAVYPHPTATGTSLDITYAKCPARMRADSDVPEIPEEHHPALVDYAIPCLRSKEGGQEFINSLKYFDRFLEQADKFATYIRARNKGLLYDRGPFEMKAFDRSRLVEAMKGKGTKTNG